MNIKNSKNTSFGLLFKDFSWNSSEFSLGIPQRILQMKFLETLNVFNISPYVPPWELLQKFIFQEFFRKLPRGSFQQVLWEFLQQYLPGVALGVLNNIIQKFIFIFNLISQNILLMMTSMKQSRYPWRNAYRNSVKHSMENLGSISWQNPKKIFCRTNSLFLKETKEISRIPEK